jgi:transcriptional regulator with XRE-family HTH domain
MIYGMAEKIRALRLQKGFTQTEIAKRLNITKNSVNVWETGACAPSLINLARLAQIFGVSTDYLLGVSDRTTVDITDFNELQREAVQGLTQVFAKMNSE